MDNYEIHGCTVNMELEVRRVPDNEAQFFTVYKILPDGTSEAIQDFDTKQQAENFLNTLL